MPIVGLFDLSEGKVIENALLLLFSDVGIQRAIAILGTFHD